MSCPADGAQIYQAITNYCHSKESKNLNINWSVSGEKKKQIMFISHQKELALTRALLDGFCAVVGLFIPDRKSVV